MVEGRRMPTPGSRNPQVFKGLCAQDTGCRRDDKDVKVCPVRQLCANPSMPSFLVVLIETAFIEPIQPRYLGWYLGICWGHDTGRLTSHLIFTHFANMNSI